jgi:hypothetical protein
LLSDSLQSFNRNSVLTTLNSAIKYFETTETKNFRLLNARTASAGEINMRSLRRNLESTNFSSLDAERNFDFNLMKKY